MEYFDILGQEIEVGDYIIYSAVDGRSGVLRIGQVIALGERKEYYKDDPIPTLRVRSASLHWGGEVSPHTRPTTLGFMSRTVVVDEKRIPAKWKEAIAKVKGK